MREFEGMSRECFYGQLVGLHYTPAIRNVMKVLLYCIALHCIVLHCIVLYCIVLYCIVLYCIVLYCIVLYCIGLYCNVLYCIVLYCIVHVLGGCSPKKSQKIPVATPKSVNWDWVFLGFFGIFWVF